MAIKHYVTLSTTEPNNEVGIIKVRQADEETQTLVVNITENGVPKSYEGLAVYFCAKLGQSTGLGVVEQKLKTNELTDPASGKLEYTLRQEDWQKVGRQRGYFSFRTMVNEHEFTEQFTTRDFTFIVTKNIYSDGVTEIKHDGSTYIWTIEDMLRLFKEYIATGKTDWENFVEQNREILESVDPGGVILTELIDARGNFDSVTQRIAAEENEREQLETQHQLLQTEVSDAHGTYSNLNERFNNQIGLNNDFRSFETESSFMKRVFNEFTERGINPEWYTSVSNNDTEKVQLAINHAINTKKELVLTKDYYIDGIVIDKSLTIRGNGHALYANKPGVEKFISIIATSDQEETTIQLFSLSVINATDCIYGVFNDSVELRMHQCLVKGFVTANVVGKPNAGGSGGYLNIDNLQSHLSENGILSLGATDHKINRYMGYNCMTHINGLGGNSYLFNSHGWNYNSETKNWINGSKFVAVNDSCTMSNIYADTVEIAVDLSKANSLNWALIAIENLAYFINKSTYPNQTETNGVPTPKIFTDLDLFKGQLTVRGLNVDFNGWLDKNNQGPKIASGKIDTSRLKFGGLNANGLNDVHGINLKISQVINDYLSYEATYLQHYSFKSLSKLGKTKMFAGFSLKEQVPNGALISEITLNAANITLSQVHIITCDVIGWIASGATYKLGARVSGDKIKIYNTSGQTITDGVEINIEVDSFLC